VPCVDLLARGVGQGVGELFASILGTARLAMGHGSVDPAIHSALARISVLATQGAQLTRDLMVTVGRAPFATKVLDANRVFGTAAAAGQVDFTPDPGNPTVFGDPDLLATLVAELLSNARQAGAGNDVRVALRTVDEAPCGAKVDGAPSSWLHLSVADGGLGMRSEVRERARDAFFTTRTGARGLGLAVSSGIAASMGGCLELSSTRGKGTRVDVFFPLDQVNNTDVT
jgi:signal transduction histidine kinase